MPRVRPQYRRGGKRIGVLAACLVLLAASCSTKSSSNREAGDASKSTTTVPGVVQHLWVLDRVVAVGLDGKEIDLSKKLLALAGKAAAKPFEFAAGSTFAVSSTFQPDLVDGDGKRLDSVSMLGGVIETTEGDRNVAILATPETDQRVVDRGYTIEVPIPTNKKVTVGTPMVTDYANVKYLPIAGASGLKGDGKPLELLRARAAAGAVDFVANAAGGLFVSAGNLGIALDGPEGSEAGKQPKGQSRGARVPSKSGSKIQPVSQRVDARTAAQADPAGDAKSAVVREITERTAKRMGIPDDAKYLIDSIAEGAEETLTDSKCRSATCIKKLTDKIEKGFEESWKKGVEEKLNIDPPDSKRRNPRKNPPGNPPNNPPKNPRKNPPTLPPTVPPNTPPRTPPRTPPDSPPQTPPNTPPNTPPGTPPNTPPGTPPGKNPPGGKGGGGGGGNGGGGSIYADPHVKTFDGARYDLQVVGEVVTAKSTEWEIQSRLAPVPCDCLASIISAVVVSDGTHRVEVRFADQRLVTVDGKRKVDLEKESPVVVGDLTIERVARGIALSHAEGDTVRVGVRHASLDVGTVPNGTSWTGLLGNANGDPNDDFQTATGEDLGPDPAEEIIVGDFVDSWRVTDANSLFTYDSGESTKTFTDVTFPAPKPGVSPDKLAADRAARKAQAQKVCQLSGITDPAVLESCVFDFIATGNPGFVRAGQDVEAFERAMLAANGAYAGSSNLPGGATGMRFDGESLRETKATQVQTGSGIALVSTENDKRMHLHAVDLATHSERWSRPDVAKHCRPTVVDGVGVIAQLQDGSPTLGDDKAALVLLSLDDGSELARYVPTGDERLPSCDGALMARGDVVMHRRGDGVRAFRVGNDIAPLWTTDRKLMKQVVALENDLLISYQKNDSNVFERLDKESGNVTATLAIPGGVVASIVPAGKGFVSVTMDKSKEEPPALALVDVTGAKLRTKWVHKFTDDEPRRPGHVVRVGDVLTGWSKPERGNGLAAWKVSDGSLAWTYTATSFDNSRGLIATWSDRVLLSPFAGSWLEVVDAKGSRVKLIDGPKGFEGAVQITPIDDETVIVTGGSKAGAYVTFVQP